MNSKAFRRNHGPKPKSTSSTFISLHFNKSDEDQLEISYKNDKKEAEDITDADTSQSNFYVANAQSSSDNLSDILLGETVDKNIKYPLSGGNTALRISKSCENKLPAEDTLDKPSESQLPKVVKNVSQCTVAKKSDAFQPEQNEDVHLQTSIAPDLSPAIEAAEVVNSDAFNHYINDELEKAKCEILDLKKETQSSSLSEKLTKNPFFAQDVSFDLLQDPKMSEHKTDEADGPVKSGSYFNFIFQNSIKLMKFAQNSVKFHLFFAILAFACAPIPSWLSGFLVGAILSSSFVYWLYKPQKNKKSFYAFNYVSPAIVSHFQEESGILKGWMNELPTCMSYSPERYHVSSTRSVYVRLEGSYVRFSFPQKNIPKRAMFNEPRYEMQFIHQQHYDITDATIELLPQGLNHKRLWSKKYPICLRIPNHKGAVLSKGSDADGSLSARASKRDHSNKKFLPRINENNEIVIYLFSRTDRDKSLWFSRFLKASRVKVVRPHSPTLCSKLPDQDSFESKRTLSVDFASLQSTFSEEEQEEDELDESFVKLSLSKQQKFEMYMAALLAPLYAEHPFAAKKDRKDATDKRSPVSLTWLNVLIGRLFFDFLVEDVWSQLVSAKIQRKLNRIKLPFFLSELIVKDIHLGSALPKVHNTSDPCTDERGLWIDLDISYNGSFHMTLETKLNLTRFKPDSEALFTEEETKSSLCNSDEDSLESSSDEDYPSLETEKDREGSGSKSKKLLKFVDKLAQSSYFQHAAKNKFVKRAMDEMSNTPLVLTVEIQWLTGTLAINIPPWPTDRLWYGFRTNPSLSITARPKLGQHVVTFTQVTEWIEKKLTSEFQKLLVMPNMDDLIIPIMLPNQDVVSWISKGSALFI